MAATAAIGVALAQGALAASFSVSGQSFKVKAAQLDGTDFVQYGGVAPGPGGVSHPVVVSGFKTATITKMCQSVATKLPIINESVTLVLNAGGGKEKVSATNLYLDVASLQTDEATFGDMEIGVPAGPLKKAGEKGDLSPYAFGQKAATAKLTNVRQTAWATTAGSFTLPDLSLSLKVGDPKNNECYQD
ncbi:DUF6230 family protein [Streptomyces sp. NPDC087420]|uniref:DUF6230 family protein n=1 Tax=Streptomyces sp. NPDC087420 TaxID=3365785 RepID=UPI0038366B5F